MNLVFSNLLAFDPGDLGCMGTRHNTECWDLLAASLSSLCPRETLDHYVRKACGRNGEKELSLGIASFAQQGCNFHSG